MLNMKLIFKSSFIFLLFIFQACSSVNAKNIQNVVDPTPSRTFKVKSFDCPSSNGYFPISPGACEANYYQCVDYMAFFWRCPKELVFDPLTLSCTTFERCSCEHTTPRPHPTTLKPTSRPKPFECPVSNGYFPVSPGACVAKYYQCVNDMAFFLSCPKNFVFDPLTLSCTLFEAASCSKTTMMPTTAPSTKSTTPGHLTTPQPFKCQKGEDGYFPYPGHCDQFIICSNGNTYTMNCPAGLYFNPTIKVCDYDSIILCDK